MDSLKQARPSMTRAADYGDLLWSPIHFEAGANVVPILRSPRDPSMSGLNPRFVASGGSLGQLSHKINVAH